MTIWLRLSPQLAGIVAERAKQASCGQDEYVYRLIEDVLLDRGGDYDKQG